MRYHIKAVGALFISALCITNKANAQANLKTAGELSGIIWQNKDNSGFSFGYELTKTEAIFTYSSIREETNNKDPQNIHPNYIGHNFRISTALEENTTTFLTDGKAQPGLGLYYEHIFNPNTFTQNTAFWLIRFGYDVKQNSFGSLQNNTIEVNKRFSQTLNVTPGVNFIMGGANSEDNLIIGLTSPIKFNVNPTDNLKPKEYITDYTAAQNGVVQKTEKAWQGQQEDYFSITPKVDIAWTPLTLEDEAGMENGPRFGLLTSFSTKINFKEDHSKVNFSIGPSMHPKWSTSQVLATVQAEFLDITDVNKTKDFDDIFSIKFYIGLPLNFK